MQEAGKRGEMMDERIAVAIRERVKENKLRCGAAFHIVKELDVTPLMVGKTADELEVRLSRCQLGLFGYGHGDEKKKVVKPAKEVSPELEQAVREGLVEGQLSCAAIWAIADRFEMPKLYVANAVEKLDLRIRPCQLGAF